MITALHVLNTLAPGGAETLVLRLCGRFADVGVRPIVAVLRGGGQLEAEFSEVGARIVHLGRGAVPSILAPASLARYLRAENVDIVHTHLVHAGIVGKLAAAATSTPVVTTRHYTGATKAGTLTYRFEDVLTTFIPSRVIAVGDAVRERLIADGIVGSERIVVHENAVDLEAFAARPDRNQSDGTFVVGTIGRLHPVKAQDVLIRAISLARESVPGIRCIIIGEGPERERLVALRDSLGLRDIVELPGAVPPSEIPVWHARFDVFALSSHTEGLPVVLIEAAASGLPTVATRVGSIGDVVQDRTSGLLVPPGEPKAFADALVELAASPSLRAEMGRAARDAVLERFDVRRLAEQTAALYRSVLSDDR